MNLKRGDWVELLCTQRDSDEHDRPRFTPAGAQCQIREITWDARLRHFHVVCPANGMWVIIDDGAEAEANLKPIPHELCTPRELALRLLVEALADNIDTAAHPDGAELTENPSLWVAGQIGLARYDFARRVLGLEPHHPRGITS